MGKSSDNSKKIVMIGCLQMGLSVSRHLLENGVKISCFVTIAKEKAKSQKVSGYVSYEDLALEFSVPIYFVEKYSLKSPKDISFFEEQEFDLMIQGGWQRLFPNEILKTLRLGAIGIHGSSEFLPKGRGRSPINWSIINGEKRFIFHYFLIKPGIDDGDVFHYESVDINDWDSCQTLYYKNSIVTQKVYLEWVPKLLQGKIEVLPQVGEPSYFPKRTAEDGLVNWNAGVFSIYNFIRALTRPYPGAFSYLNDQKVIIWGAQPFDTRISFFGSENGEIIEVFETGDIVINCGDGLLLLTDYESPDKIDLSQELKVGSCFEK